MYESMMDRVLGLLIKLFIFISGFAKELSRRVLPITLREHGWNGRKPLLGIAVINPFIWPVRASLRKWIQSGLTGKHEGRYDKWYYYSDSPERRIDYDRHCR